MLTHNLEIISTSEHAVLLLISISWEERLWRELGWNENFAWAFKRLTHLTI